jgi:hypothetical protein
MTIASSNHAVPDRNLNGCELRHCRMNLFSSQEALRQQGRCQVAAGDDGAKLAREMTAIWGIAVFAPLYDQSMQTLLWDGTVNRHKPGVERP